MAGEVDEEGRGSWAVPKRSRDLQPRASRKKQVEHHDLDGHRSGDRECILYRLRFFDLVAVVREAHSKHLARGRKVFDEQDA